MNPAAKQTASPTRPLPLVIGVTGHRDLRPQDRGQLETTVRQILEQLQADYRHTSLVLLSALAEGADCLVAQVALDLGIRLIVPLPMPEEEYKREFTSDNARAEFYRLLQQAEKSFPLPPISETVGNAGNSEAGRNQAYALVGAYIARNSQILLALWDGADSTTTCGTAQVVRFKLRGVDAPWGPKRNPLDPVDSGPTCQVVTPRASVAEEPADAFMVRLLLPTDAAEQAIREIHPPFRLLSNRTAERVHRRILRRMDRFNRDVGRRWGVLAQRSEQSMGHVFSAATAMHLPASATSALAYYGVADALALHYQRWTLRSVRAIVLLVMAAAICYQIYASAEPKPLWLLIGYLATFVGAYLVYAWGRWGLDCHNKYLDYRALAEGLRVRMFWRLAGIKTQVADRYLSKQHSEMDWIRQAIRVWTIPAHADTASAELAAADPARLQLVLDHWVKDQERFFQKAAKRNERRARLFVALSSGFFFLAGFGLAVVKVSPLNIDLPSVSY